MLDLYFRRPIFWDYCFAMILVLLTKTLLIKKILVLPKDDYLFPIVSDLSTISLTLSGFILTLLTVLVSYKSTVKKKPKDERLKENESTYDLFFSTQLYFETVKHLKNAIKSMVIVAIIGYFLKLTMPPMHYEKLFLFTIFGITIIVLTIWRCVLILSGIIKLQEGS